MDFEPPFKCLYCLKNKNEVSFTKVEHTIPESLGNQSYVLPVGFVCDNCNKSFSKIENTVLSSSMSNLDRISAGILTKKKRYPKIERPGIKIEFQEKSGMPHFHFNEVEAGENLVFDAESRTINSTLDDEKPIQQHRARFLLKAGLGLLLFIRAEEKFKPDPYSQIFNSSRDFARFPKRNDKWKVWTGIIESNPRPTLSMFTYGSTPDGSIMFYYIYGSQAFACNLIAPEIDTNHVDIEIPGLRLRSLGIKEIVI